MVASIKVVDLTPSGVEAVVYERLEEGLRLLKSLDPRQFERIRGDASCIVLIDAKGPAGEYWSAIHAIALDAQNLVRQQPLANAMTIVHEGVHARLHASRVPYVGWEERAERLCVKQEVALARRSGPNDALVKGALLKLESEWWLKQPTDRRPAERIEAYKIPEWLRKILGTVRW